MHVCNFIHVENENLRQAWIQVLLIVIYSQVKEKKEICIKKIDDQ